MAVEEQIVAWAATRPNWQRFVLHRAASGKVFTEKELDELANDLLIGQDLPTVAFGLEHLAKSEPGDASVSLLSIASLVHVNALESNQPLTFQAVGLTIVYGDNGSGKSGYARLLKRITRARDREEVLSDVFRNTSLEKPAATVTVLVGAGTVELAWPHATPPELQRIRFYDSACGAAYAATESDFPYRPSALYVMDGLIEACLAIRDRIEAKLEENAQKISPVPIVPVEVRHTEIGRFLEHLSGASKVEDLDRLTAPFSEEAVDQLKKEEARLRNTDAQTERRGLLRQVEKLEALSAHLEKIQVANGDGRIVAIQQLRDRISNLQDAVRLLVQPLESEPLGGAGSQAWRSLWESARRFSEEHAYRHREFPVLDTGARCVLCQQELAEDAVIRFSRFDAFTKNDIEVQIGAARGAYELEVQRLRSPEIWTEAVTSHHRDLELTHEELMRDVRELLERYRSSRESAVHALSDGTPLLPTGIEPGSTATSLRDAASSARARASNSDAELIRAQLEEVTTKRHQAELGQQVITRRTELITEIARRKEREALEAAKAAAATGQITRKIAELSEEGVTEVVRDAFTRETDRLRLERVTLARMRAEKGAVLHQPKLVGTRQEVTLPRVLSEGERSALGLAAFFTDAQLDHTKSTLILDDPVSSLDHVRRGLVAARLTEFARGQQVVVFTHDVAFVADLKREANGRGVSVAERTVARSRGDERKPGLCTSVHPWKAKDVPARLDTLRADLARIKRESPAWDQQTYENNVANWAGDLSETWERIFSQEIVGSVLAEGGLEVRPLMVKVLARFTEVDRKEFEASYSRVSQWVRRHDKSSAVNYVAPDNGQLESELALVTEWFKRVKSYKT
jgi:energy-coupling factor transporter ATP-binding protein EcfA2